MLPEATRGHLWLKAILEKMNIWGPAVCMGILRKIQRKIRRANMKNIDFLWFFKDIRAKNFGKTLPRPRATFWQILSPVQLNTGHLVTNFHSKKGSKTSRNKNRKKSRKKRSRNNQTKKSKKVRKSLKNKLPCLFGALRPFQTCRSLFCGSNGTSMTSGNLNGASLVTKQGPKSTNLLQKRSKKVIRWKDNPLA